MDGVHGSGRKQRHGARKYNIEVELGIGDRGTVVDPPQRETWAKDAVQVSMDAPTHSGIAYSGQGGIDASIMERLDAVPLPSGRRVAIMRIPSDVFCEAFHLPPNTLVVGARGTDDLGVIEVSIEHCGLKPLQMGDRVPCVTPHLSRVDAVPERVEFVRWGQ